MTLRQVYGTWWPLAASWLMMGFELPAVSATMARLPLPEISLAAYGGVVFPLALLIEAPIIMLLSASTALSRDLDTYRRLRRFMLASGFALTLLHLAVAVTPLFDLVVVRLLGAPEAIHAPARLGLLILTPWTWSIAYRRFQQGVLIRFGRARLVGVGTAVRLGVNLLVLLAGYLHGGFAGIVVGTAAVSAGVLAEALYAGIVVRPILRREIPQTAEGDPLTLRAFIDFYTPLALTATFGLLALPLGSAAMGRLPRPIDSLAVWPVINGLTFTLRSVGHAYAEVVVALLDRPGAYAALRRFTGLLAAAATLLLFAIAATPLSPLWFRGVSALPPDLAALAGAALWVGLPLPALSVLQHWYQGVLTQARRTRAVGEAIVIFLATSAAVLGAGILHGGIPGIYVGLAATGTGYLAQCLWLAHRSRALRQRFREGDAAEFAPAAAAVLAALLIPLAPGAAGAVVPDGFVLEKIVGEPFQQQPVAFALLPDGRPVLVERPNGVVRLAAAGAATSDSIHTIPGVEGVHPERGLLGVAVDPAWPARPYLYFHFTHVDSVTRIVMLTASGDLTDPASTAVTLGAEYVLLDDIPDLNGIHNAGTLRFAPDGTLIVSCGDDAQSCLAQDLTSPLGKILRLDVSAMPGAGSGPPDKAALTPADNPFPGPDPWERLVYAWGLRNPFRFTVDAPTGRLFLGSVGSSFFEEINLVPPGGGLNYGWPQWEGTMPIQCCGTCGQGNAFTDAIHLLPHPLPVVSVCGGPVMRPVPASPASFPPAYDGDLFYFEVFSGTLHRLRESGGLWDFAPPVPGQPADTVWADSLYGVSDAQLGPDGALWFVSFGYCCGVSRGLYRISADPAFTGAPEPAAAPARLRATPTPFRAAEGTRIHFSAGGAGKPPEVLIHTADGRRVRRIPSRAGGTGETSVRWDARDDRGAPVPPGVYFARVKGQPGSVKITVLR